MASSTPDSDWDFSNTGRIHANELKITIAVLFAVAVLFFIGRIAIRLFTRKRLFWDDGFLILAFLCLCGSTVIIISRLRYEYLFFAVARYNQPAYRVAMSNQEDFFSQAKMHSAYLALLWTACFGVKWCYLAFFRSLLRNMPRWFIYYYWFSVALCVISWVFIGLSEQLTGCPRVGDTSDDCFRKPNVSHTLLVTFFWLYPSLDAGTDLMIISIAIGILRQVQIKPMTKVGLGLFLCLSAFMIVCAIIRGAAPWYQGTFDYPWGAFWLHVEACIAVTMGSLTVYRSTLIGTNEVSDVFRVYSNRIKHHLSSMRSTKHSSSEHESGSHAQNGQPGFQRRMLPGFRTLLGRDTHIELTSINSRETGVDVPEEPDYHAVPKAPGGQETGSGSRR